MKAKKGISMLLVSVMTLGLLAGCGSREENQTEEPKEEARSQTEEESGNAGETEASSGMGESGQLLEEMAGTGEWQEGERFSSGVSESEVSDWVEGLGL